MKRAMATSTTGARKLARSGTFYIYALIDPRDRAVRYVGCTVDPKKRYYAHLAAQMMAEGNRAWCDWVDELRALRLRPEMVVLDTRIGIRAAHISEQAIVNAGYALGWRLFNRKKTAGGGLAQYGLKNLGVAA